ncbi:hypothetical protein L1049_014591 [Liquidambar formosana]|uniref:F-box domain-containing protein n=1 Tax=Liquidambar formosana TaxID=63359 RepID=A0AAP0X0J0_LIQFO
MAEWSQLPKELLDVIAQRLQTPFDILRFRSVCSTWRSAVRPKPRRLPNRFPILPNDGISNTTWGFFLSKRTIFRLGFLENSRENPTTTPPSDPNGWLIKIEEANPDRMHLLNPLSRCEFKPLPTNFPRVLDLLKFSVSELGQEYVLQYMNYRPSATSMGDAANLYMEKVVFCPEFCPRSGSIDGYVLLTIHVSGKLTMFKSGEKKWTVIDDMPSPYDDVVLFDGKFYAVDSTGRTVVVGLSSTVTLVAKSVFGGDKKYLVESGGALLLVDMYLSMDPEEDLGDGQIALYISERIVRFKVFRLDENEQKWVEVKSIGDRVLFLGDNSTFSASASDFSGCKGNCIYFTDNSFYSIREEDGAFRDGGIGVFDLENGSIGPLANYPDYSRMFWPPPSWVTSTMMEQVQNHFEDLSL